MILHLNQNPFFLFFHPSVNHRLQLPLVQPQKAAPFRVPLIEARNFRCSKAPNVACLSFSSVDSLQPPLPVKRVPRLIRIEAQRVLMDYLHSTRGYTFSDAEYISNNCPHFVRFLASKVVIGNVGEDGDGDADADVARSLRKFLRYNPINEFEPFFESLGIGPSELNLFLPCGMFFLADDSALVDNFHFLCNYGIPRNRMGKIFKEAKEVFGYDTGILMSKFRAYEEDLGLSRSMIIKLVACCPSLLVGDGGVNGEFMVVLDWLRRSGIEDDWVVNYMSCSKTYSWGRMVYTIQFLRKWGCSERNMHDLFKANPKLLLNGFGKKMEKFLVRLLNLGVDVNFICSCFTEYPHMSKNKSAENLLKVFNFLSFIGMEKDDIAHIFSNNIHPLSTNSLKGLKTICLESKVEKSELCRVIKDDPLKLISMASSSELKSPEQTSGHDPHKHLEKTTFLMKLGYTENSEEMAKALKMFRGRGDQLQERFDCLVEAGLDYNSVIGMVKRAPMILTQKKDLIQKKIDFVRNILGYPLECLVVFPSYFCYDLERIVQRLSMYAWLKERKAINPSLTLSTIVSSNDKRFVKYFVNVHPQGPTIWKGIKSLSNIDKN